MAPPFRATARPSSSVLFQQPAQRFGKRGATARQPGEQHVLVGQAVAGAQCAAERQNELLPGAEDFVPDESSTVDPQTTRGFVGVDRRVLAFEQAAVKWLAVLSSDVQVGEHPAEVAVAIAQIAELQSSTAVIRRVDSSKRKLPVRKSPCTIDMRSSTGALRLSQCSVSVAIGESS